MSKQVSLTIDILQEKALQQIMEMQELKLIRITQDIPNISPKKWRGALGKASLKEVDKQLDQIRGEWE